MAGRNKRQCEHTLTAIARRLGAAIVVAIAVSACGPSSGDTATLTLDELVRFAERYDDQTVSTSGILRTHDDPEHYWIEDNALNRVEIRPMDRVDELVGKTIRVEGEFSYSRKTGRILRVDELTVTP